MAVDILHKHFLQQPFRPLHGSISLAVHPVYFFIDDREEIGDFCLFFYRWILN
jgi:hypothetical protein